MVSISCGLGIMAVGLWVEWRSTNDFRVLLGTNQKRIELGGCCMDRSWWRNVEVTDLEGFGEWLTT